MTTEHIKTQTHKLSTVVDHRYRLNRSFSNATGLCS